jgi:folate-binding protein YgfZ
MATSLADDSLVPRYFALPLVAVFMVSGKDSRRYLNARLSADIRSLGKGDSRLAAMLSAQGKTEGLFRIQALDDSTFVIVAWGGENSLLTESLKRFIVADRVTVEDVTPQFSLLHVTPQSYAQKVLSQLSKSDQLYTLCIPAERGYLDGVDVLLPQSLCSELFALLAADGTKSVPQSEAELARIRHGHPDFPKEIGPDSLFQESGLTDAIAFGKGCYVGQEVIERVDAIGKLPKRLRRLRIEAELASSAIEQGLSVTSSDGYPLGRLLSIAFDPSEKASFAFASLRNTRHDGRPLAPGDRVLVSGAQALVIE